MMIQLHPDNPPVHKVDVVTGILEKNGVVIVPTDSVYAFACDLNSKKGFERICALRRIDPSKALFSIMVSDLSQASPYIAQIPNKVFKTIKRNTPGPFTFILEGGRELPGHLKKGRKTIGVRIPEHKVIRNIVARLGRPLITTSLRSDDDILEYFNDPEEIHDNFENLVDCVVDSGTGNLNPSTILDCTGDMMEVIREGRAQIQF